MLSASLSIFHGFLHLQDFDLNTPFYLISFKNVQMKRNSEETRKKST